MGGLLFGVLAVLLVRGKRVARSFAGGVAAWGVPMMLLAFADAPYWPYLMFGLIGVANPMPSTTRAYTARCSR
jgi:hypothetical protein